MSEQQNRDTLERYVQALIQHDMDTPEEYLHDDYVEEFSQSGEWIRGKQNYRSIAQNYPGLPEVSDYSYRISGDLAVVEMSLTYDGNRMDVCEIVDFEAAKIKRTRWYFAELFEALEWRAQWVERM
jgi:hypothetical protein